ncbi:MAG: thiamine pyrophosphate-dependent dehydrogenase E1 component subunit alpha [Acidobacteria bacterium]|nr:thiamine pyrophosphate-dependent dehydrogenase E1 component subunit alpha [Acidobacteriota bacterium]
MPEPTLLVDRRGLLKAISAAGATSAVLSNCGSSYGRDANLTGGKWDKTIPLATAGPGGNRDWKPGDAAKFLPPEKISTRGPAASALAELGKAKLLDIYHKMCASRKWETAMKDLFTGGKDGLYGSFHTYIGEEAIACGVMAALRDDDYIASTHRGHGHLIAKGGDLKKMAAEIFFKETGYNKGYGGSMHITDMSKGIMGMNGIVGASFYLAAGAAIRGQVRETGQVAVAFFGDGAANSPYYFSAVRSCANYKVPVIFVNENNFQYMGVPMATVTPTKYISDYTRGLDIPHHVVDGNDVSAVYAATRDAVEWGRAGRGPTVVEGITYRWYDHSGFAGGKAGVDGAFGLPYRSDEEVRQWMSRDPVSRYKTWLLDKGLASAEELAKVESDTTREVEQSIEFARQSKDPEPSAGVHNTSAAGPMAATQFFNRSGIVFRAKA